MRRPLTQMGLLSRAQIRADFQYLIATRQTTGSFETLEDVARQNAAAGANLEDRAVTKRLEDLGAMARDACAEKPRDLRSGRKIPSGSKLVRAGAVVAESGRIERQIHVAVEADPAACPGHRGGNMIAHKHRVRGLVFARLGFTLPGSSGIVDLHDKG